MPRLRNAVTWFVPAVAIAASLAVPVNASQPAEEWEPQIVMARHVAAAPGSPAARPGPRALPQGIGSERGLQVKTILAKRAVLAKFPQITEISGYRPDPMKWHPNGLAIDFAIPDYDTPAGRALGDRITEFVLANAERFSLEYVIWQRMYIPAKGKPKLMADLGNDDANHYTHVHVSTYGGGYPRGGEVYLG